MINIRERVEEAIDSSGMKFINKTSRMKTIKGVTRMLEDYQEGLFLSLRKYLDDIEVGDTSQLYS